MPVLGAGIIGASTAHYLARRRAGVTLVDLAGPAAQASGRFAAEELFEGARIARLAPCRPVRFETA